MGAFVSWDYDFTNTAGQTGIPGTFDTFGTWELFNAAARKLDTFQTISSTETTELKFNLVPYFKSLAIGWQNVAALANDPYGVCQFTVGLYAYSATSVSIS